MKRHQPVILSMWTFPPTRSYRAAISNLYAMLIYALLLDGNSDMHYRLDPNGKLLSKIQMERDIAMLLLRIKVYLHIGLLKDPVGWTPLHITGLLID